MICIVLVESASWSLTVWCWFGPKPSANSSDDVARRYATGEPECDTFLAFNKIESVEKGIICINYTFQEKFFIHLSVYWRLVWFRHLLTICVDSSSPFQHQNFTTIVINTLRSRQEGCHFPDDVFTCIFAHENVENLVAISLKFVPALLQIMAWRGPGDKPLNEPMMISLLVLIYASLGLNELRVVTERTWTIICKVSYGISTRWV